MHEPHEQMHCLLGHVPLSVTPWFVPSLQLQMRATLQSEAVLHAPHAPLLHVPTLHVTVDVTGMPSCEVQVSMPEPSPEQ